MKKRYLILILQTLVLTIVALGLLCLLSCSASRRVATQTETTDRTVTRTDRDSSGGSQAQGVSLTRWMEQLSRDVSTSWTLDFDSARVSAQGIILYGGRGEGQSSTQEQSRTQRVDTVYIAVRDSSSIREQAAIRADVETKSDEKPLPVPRTAMWVCITVALVVGYLVFRKLTK